MNITERKRKLFHNNIPYSAEKTVIPKTAVFERLTVYSYGKKTDYSAVREHLRGFSKSVIMCRDCVLPAESGIFEFSSDELRAHMTFNSLEGLLTGVKNKNRLKLAAADRTGRYSFLLGRTVSLAGEVTVLTDNEMKYSFASQEVYEEYGAVVNIRPFQSSIPDCSVFVSLSSGGPYPLRILIKNAAAGGFVSLSGNSFSFPAKIEKYVPENVDRYSFASALFSLSGVKELAKLHYDTFEVNSRLISFPEALKMLDTLLKF